MYPRLVFTGANAPTTVREFPRGEAVHYREYAIEHGVPAEAVSIETKATNTQENLVFTRELLAQRGITVGSVLLMSRPYQQRRAYATCRMVWPEVQVVCASRPQSLDDYVATIGDAKRVVDMIVGDTQRVVEYAERGSAIPQEMPDRVYAAYSRLVEAGFTSRLLTTGE
jgi:uncharacterized SAM-binding protein YcdF (DUF218 family)